MGFLRKGKRQEVKHQKKKTKQHLKEFYKILHELEDVAVEIKKSGKKVTEHNIIDVASEYTNRKIGKFEKSILLSKINGNES